MKHKSKMTASNSTILITTVSVNELNIPVTGTHWQIR